MWLPPEHAIALALTLVIAGGMGRRRPGTAWERVSPFATEAALVLGLYALWRVAGRLPLTREHGAFERAWVVWDIQRWMHLPSEVGMQDFLLSHDWLARAANAFYAVAHAPGAIICLVWLFARHRDRYPAWRNALAVVTAACLFLRFIRVAPPRLLPELGFVDVAARYDQSVYGPVGTGVSDQLAAMPSMHVAWALWVGVAAVMVSRSRWRWLALAHSVVTMWVVMATANHWWLDGIVAGGLLAGAMLICGCTRQGAPAVAPAPVLVVTGQVVAPICGRDAHTGHHLGPDRYGGRRE